MLKWITALEKITNNYVLEFFSYLVSIGVFAEVYVFFVSF